MKQYEEKHKCLDVQLIRDYLHIVTLSILSSKYRRPEKQNLSRKYLPVSHFCNPIYRFYKLNALKDFNLFQLLCINWQSHTIWHLHTYMYVQCVPE